MSPCVPYYILLNVPYARHPTVSYTKNGSAPDLLALEKAMFNDIVWINSAFITEKLFCMLEQELLKPAGFCNLSFGNFMNYIDPDFTCTELLQTYAFLDGKWCSNPLGTQEMLFNKLIQSALTILEIGSFTLYKKQRMRILANN